MFKVSPSSKYCINVPTTEYQNFKLYKTVFKYVPYGNIFDIYPYLLRRLYENIDIKYSTINNHDNSNVENIPYSSLLNGPERLSISPNFEISKFMGLSKKTMNRCHRQNNI